MHHASLLKNIRPVVQYFRVVMKNIVVFRDNFSSSQMSSRHLFLRNFRREIQTVQFTKLHYQLIT